MLRTCSILIVTLLVVVTRQATLVAQTAAQLPDFSAVLQNHPVLESSVKQFSDSFAKWSTMSDDELYHQIQQKHSGGDVDIEWWEFFSANADVNFDDRSEVLRVAHSSISEWAQKTTNSKTESLVQSDKPDADAIRAWQTVLLAWIHGLDTGSDAVVIDLDSQTQPWDAIVKYRIRFRRPKDYTGPAPVVTGVTCGSSIKNAAQIMTTLMGKQLGDQEVTLERAPVCQDFVSIVTDQWSNKAIILNPPPAPNDAAKTAEALWMLQKQEAFQRGDLVVASQGCFSNEIRVAFVPPPDTRFSNAKRILWMWGLSPDPYGHRAGFWAIENPNLREFRLTPKLWSNNSIGIQDSPDQQQHPTMPSRQVIYFQAGYAWGPNRPDNPNSNFGPVVAGWMLPK